MADPVSHIGPATDAHAERSGTMSEMSNAQAAHEDLLARAVVIAFAILQILTPMLPWLGIGEPIGERSASARSLITPAGWAFSIWGPLYTGSIVYAVYQVLPAQRGRGLVARLRWPAAGAFLGNALWAAYTQVFGLTAISAIIIVATLACLLAAYRTIAGWPKFTARERWCVVLPLSALTAWLTVATIVNISASLRFHGVDAGGAEALVAAAIVVIGGLIAGLALARSQGNPPYALVFLWALSAIYAAGGQRAGLLAGAVGIAALTVVVGAAIGLRKAGANRWFGAASTTG